jgi:hypothetical protein
LDTIFLALLYWAVIIGVPLYLVFLLVKTIAQHGRKRN